VSDRRVAGTNLKGRIVETFCFDKATRIVMLDCCGNQFLERGIVFLLHEIRREIRRQFSFAGLAQQQLADRLRSPSRSLPNTKATSAALTSWGSLSSPRPSVPTYSASAGLAEKADLITSSAICNDKLWC
jgi:hypothetical protein